MPTSTTQTNLIAVSRTRLVRMTLQDPVALVDWVADQFGWPAEHGRRPDGSEGWWNRLDDGGVFDCTRADRQLLFVDAPAESYLADRPDADRLGAAPTPEPDRPESDRPESDRPEPDRPEPDRPEPADRTARDVAVDELPVGPIGDPVADGASAPSHDGPAPDGDGTLTVEHASLDGVADPRSVTGLEPEHEPEHETETETEVRPDEPVDDGSQPDVADELAPPSWDLPGTCDPAPEAGLDDDVDIARAPSSTVDVWSGRAVIERARAAQCTVIDLAVREDRVSLRLGTSEVDTREVDDDVPGADSLVGAINWIAELVGVDADVGGHGEGHLYLDGERLAIRASVVTDDAGRQVIASLLGPAPSESRIAASEPPAGPEWAAGGDADLGSDAGAEASSLELEVPQPSWDPAPFDVPEPPTGDLTAREPVEDVASTVAAAADVPGTSTDTDDDAEPDDGAGDGDPDDGAGDGEPDGDAGDGERDPHGRTRRSPAVLVGAAIVVVVLLLWLVPVIGRAVGFEI